ncbi:MAG: hypothetical protein U9Q12_01080, partial [Patescibacteria group bacterium]|nr:hypothetical protein [Patescibacteria group bacterium]
MTDDLKGLSPEEKDLKIQSLRDMITSAEQTMQSAKAMLLQLEGKKKAGRRKKVDDEDGNVIQGTFDGQIMIGTDGKQYPIPANYASKSKLVEGDFLKLTIVSNGSFIYKQIGPVPRQNHIGIVGQDASGNYFVAVDGKPFKVLLASITYFDAQPGDEVAIVTSQEENAQWASIEAILQHTNNPAAAPAIDALDQQSADDDTPKTANAILTGSNDTASDDVTTDIIDESDDAASDIVDDNAPQDEIIEEDTVTEKDIIEEWVPDIDEIEKEIRA